MKVFKILFLLRKVFTFLFIELFTSSNVFDEVGISGYVFKVVFVVFDWPINY